MKRLSKLLMLGTGVVFLAGSVTACSHHYRSPEHRSQWMVEKMTKELDLNDVQQARLQVLNKEMQSTRQSMKQQFTDNHEQVLNLLDQPKLDQARVLGMIESHTRNINQRAPKLVSAMAEFYDSLSAEQQARVREHLREHQGTHGGSEHHAREHNAHHHDQ